MLTKEILSIPKNGRKGMSVMRYKKAYKSNPDIDITKTKNIAMSDDLVIEAANDHNLVMACCGIRLFHH